MTSTSTSITGIVTPTTSTVSTTNLTTVTATLTPTTATISTTKLSTITATVTPTTATVSTTKLSTITATVTPTTATISTTKLSTITASKTSQTSTVVQVPWTENPTVTAFKDLTASRKEGQAVKFYKGIHGGIDDTTSLNQFVEVLSQHTNLQRLQIADYYKQMFGQTMTADININLRENSDLRDLASSLVAKPGYNDAETVKDAMRGFGTREDTIIEVLASCSNLEIKQMKAAYLTLYDKDIETAIMGETSGRFETFLRSLLNGNREEPVTKVETKEELSEEEIVEEKKRVAAELEQIEADALELNTAYQSDEYKNLDYFPTFNRILCLRSFQHLKKLKTFYNKTYNISLENIIEKKFSDNEHVKKGYLAIVKLAQSQDLYFEELLFNTTISKDEKAFRRIIVSRSEKDLWAIKERLAKRGKGLADYIKTRSSASYRQLLNAIAGTD